MFHRWHPQLALRYLPIVKYIKGLGIKNPSILEVGSGSLGIGPYLRKPFTGVDVDFSGPLWPDMDQVHADAKALPFPKNSYDISLCVDVIEHIPIKHRQKVITELLRVTKKIAIIALPIGDAARQQDILLDKLYRQKFSKPFPFLKEHIKYGIPEKTEILSLIKTAAKENHQTVSVTTAPNRNLSLRLWLMKGWISKSPLTNIFFRKLLLFFIPLLKIIDLKPPHYRQIFYVNIK